MTACHLGKSAGMLRGKQVSSVMIGIAIPVLARRATWRLCDWEEPASGRCVVGTAYPPVCHRGRICRPPSDLENPERATRPGAWGPIPHNRRRKIGHADPLLRRTGSGPFSLRSTAADLPPRECPLSHRSAPANHVAPPEKNLANKARLELCVSPLASPSGF